MVNPGDLIVADQTGIVAVRIEFAAHILQQLELRRKSMSAYVAAVKRGEFSNDWVDRILEDSDCQPVDE